MGYQDYLDALPKKRIGAGCLLFSSNRQFLIVKPVYREGWLLPGGVVEKDESPKQACIREVQEEIGLVCANLRLRCVDYVASKGLKNKQDGQQDGKSTICSEALQFVFSGGVIKHEQIVIADEEIGDYRFVGKEEGLSLLAESTRRRAYWSLVADENNQTLYLENHEPQQ